MAEESSLDYNKKSSETFQMGSEATEEEEIEEENTADNVYENNPEDNKKLAEITMAEQIRKTFELKVTIPRILKGLHTNQFFFLDVTDQFYEKNYPEIIKTVADKKFGRFAGFQKGRFFIEKVEESGGIDGWSTSITLNPIPPSLATYSKMQKEAQKALVHAINVEQSYSNGGGVNVGSDIVSTELIGIANELASKYDYCGKAQSYTDMKSVGCGSCWAWSGALYTECTAKNYQCKVIEYQTSYSGQHRSVQINNNGNWEDFPYGQTNVPKMVYATSSKPGLHDISESQLQASL